MSAIREKRDRKPWGRLGGWTLVTVGALTALVLLTASVLVAPRIDKPIAQGLRAPRGSDYDWAIPITHLGGGAVIVAVLIAVVVMLVASGRVKHADAVLLASLVSEGAAQVARRLIERPRPHGALVEAAGFSFPSGHATIAMALYGTLAYLVVRGSRGLIAKLAIVGGAAVIAAIGLSGVYLGAHFPSDVLAGWLLGLLGVAAASRFMATDWRPERRAER